MDQWQLNKAYIEPSKCKRQRHFPSLLWSALIDIMQNAWFMQWSLQSTLQMKSPVIRVRGGKKRCTVYSLDFTCLLFAVPPSLFFPSTSSALPHVLSFIGLHCFQYRPHPLHQVMHTPGHWTDWLYIRKDDMPQFPGWSLSEELMPVQVNFVLCTKGICTTLLRAQLQARQEEWWFSGWKCRIWKV